MEKILEEYRISGEVGIDIRNKLYSENERESILKGILNPRGVFEELIILENNVLIYTNFLPRIFFSGETNKIKLVKERLEKEFGRKLDIIKWE